MGTRLVVHRLLTRQGSLVALHCRRYHSDGSKEVWWEQPDGTRGLGGRPVATLPLFGAHLLDSWPGGEPVYLTEGEPACVALWQAGLPAVASVTGAAVCPGRDALAVLAGWHVRCWPDADEAGERHMIGVASGLRGLARSVQLVRWGGAPHGGDAADFLVDRGGNDVRTLPLVSPPLSPPHSRYPPPAPRYPQPRPRYPARNQPVGAFGAERSVSRVLRSELGIVKATPGRSVRCPGSAHRRGDRSPSLTILRDDRRAYCHLPGCLFNNDGRGVDARDLRRIAGGGTW